LTGGGGATWFTDALARRGVDSTPAITFVDRGGISREASAASLIRAGSTLAHWLRTECGIGPGERVALIARNDQRSVEAVLGALLTGIPLLLLDPTDPPARWREQARSVGAEVMVSSVAVGPEVIELPSAAGLRPATVPTVSGAQPSQEVAFFPTSGSTAAAKIVAQPMRALRANARAVIGHHDLRPGRTVLGCLGIHHVNGFHFGLIANLVAGSHLVLLEQFDPFGYSDAIIEHRPDVASVVPSILESLVAVGDPALGDHLGYFLSAAAPLAGRTLAAVQDRFGVRVLQGYGLSEAVNFSTTVPRGLDVSAFRRWATDFDAPSVGVPLAGVTVDVVDESGAAVPDETVGEVVIGGEARMTRYVANRAATWEVLRDGRVRTGDLGRLIDDPAGRHLVLVGRLKNVCKVGGAAVSLDEVGRALRSLDGVADAVAVARADPLRGEVVDAVVVGDPGTDQAVRIRLAQELPPRALPVRITRVARLPRTPTGKLRREAVNQLLADAGRPE